MKNFALGVLASLVLVGCGGGSDSSGNGDGMGPITKPEPITNSDVCYNSRLYDIGAELVQEYTHTVNEAKQDNFITAQRVREISNSDELEIRHADDTGKRTVSNVRVDDTLRSIETLSLIDKNGQIDFSPNGMMFSFDIDAKKTITYPVVTMRDGINEIAFIDSSLKYVKSQKVSVPAGRFNTCLMEYRMTVDYVNGKSEEVAVKRNIGIGNGQIIREERVTVPSDGEQTSERIELVKGSLNGAAI